MGSEAAWTASKLAEWIAAPDTPSLPTATRRKAEDLVVDLLGSALAGFDNPAARAARATACDLFAAGPSHIWFSSGRQSPAAAAFQNSAAACALDLDDGHRIASGHPGAAVIPAVIAQAETSEHTVDELLAAIAIGYEVGVRAAAAQCDRLQRREFASGRWAPLAVAASVGFLRHCNPAVLAQALAIAAAHRPALIPSGASRTLGHVKEGIPWGTLTGFVAVELAEHGLAASLDVLDIPALFDSDAIVDRLGSARLAIDGAYIKPYSCCRWIHAPVDALQLIMSSHHLKAQQVSSLVVQTIGPAARLHNARNPQTPHEAQFSVPYCMAVAAIDGPDALLLPDPGALGRPDLIAFASKVVVEIDPELDAQFPARTPARVLVKSSQGDYSSLVEYPRGDFANPMSRDEVFGKFERIARHTLDPQAASSLMATVFDIPQQGLGPLLRAVSLAGIARSAALAARAQ